MSSHPARNSPRTGKRPGPFPRETAHPAEPSALRSVPLRGPPASAADSRPDTGRSPVSPPPLRGSWRSRPETVSASRPAVRSPPPHGLADAGSAEKVRSSEGSKSDSETAPEAPGASCRQTASQDSKERTALRETGRKAPQTPSPESGWRREAACTAPPCCTDGKNQS